MRSIRIHRTSEYRTYREGHMGNGTMTSAKLKPPESLVLSTAKSAQYRGLYSDGHLSMRPTDGAGVIDHDVRGCPECGWILDGAKCRHCGVAK